MTGKITTRRGPWRFVWQGGRLAEVWHVGKPYPLDCVQVGDYDWKHGKSETDDMSRAEVSALLADAATQWVADVGNDYAAELPYL